MIQNFTEYRVPYADVDQMQIVYYANYLIYFERGRTELLRQAELSYVEMEASGLILPVIEAHCNYLKPAKYDDLLTIKSWVDQVTRVKIKLACQVFRNDILLCEGYTWHACINKVGKPIRTPEHLKALAPNNGKKV